MGFLGGPKSAFKVSLFFKFISLKFIIFESHLFFRILLFKKLVMKKKHRLQE